MISQTLIIIIITCAVSIPAFTNRKIVNDLIMYPPAINRGQYYRLFTSGLIHANYQHLLFNMFTLYMFAPFVINSVGAMYFAYLYFGSLIAGNLLTLYFHKDEYYYRAVGASGAVMGIIYSAILLEPNLYMYGFIPGYIFGFAYLLFSIYGMKAKNDNIGHVAHFGGAIGGFVITLVKFPFLITEEPKTVMALLVPIVILFMMAKMKKI